MITVRSIKSNTYCVHSNWTRRITSISTATSTSKRFVWNIKSKANTASSPPAPLRSINHWCSCRINEAGILCVSQKKSSQKSRNCVGVSMLIWLEKLKKLSFGWYILIIKMKILSSFFKKFWNVRRSTIMAGNKPLYL